MPLLDDLEPDRAPKPVGPRIAAGTVALLLTFASFALATDLFGRVGSQPTAAVGNGKIVFAAVEGETCQIFAVEADGDGWLVSEIQILDTTGADPPRIFETSAVFPELIEWGP